MCLTMTKERSTATAHGAVVGAGSEMVERTGKLYEKYNRTASRFETVGTCPFCGAENNALDAHTMIHKCSHYESMRWGCGGAVFFFKGTRAEMEAMRTRKREGAGSMIPAYA